MLCSVVLAVTVPAQSSVPVCGTGFIYNKVYVNNASVEFRGESFAPGTRCIQLWPMGLEKFGMSVALKRDGGEMSQETQQKVS